jgi:hypothetical protein
LSGLVPFVIKQIIESELLISLYDSIEDNIADSSGTASDN